MDIGDNGMFQGATCINTFQNYLLVLVVLDEHCGNMIPIKTDRDDEGSVDGDRKTPIQKLLHYLKSTDLIDVYIQCTDIYGNVWCKLCSPLSLYI